MKKLTNRKKLKKLIALVGIVFVSTVTLSFSLIGQKTDAADLSKFDPTNIISDAVFTNNKSMTVSQIQSFLDIKNSKCLKDYSSLALIDANKNGQVEDWTNEEQYGGSTGKKTMKAAELIKAASDIYGINPQVLLVTLEKEQGLITRQDCPDWRYNTAFGFGCPDTAPCDKSAYGFTRQVDNAAYHFKNYMTGKDALGNPVYATYTTGKQPVPYHPGPCKTYNQNGTCKTWQGKYGNKRDNSYCGRPTVDIKNLATASLYTYTPYQPNKAALSAGYGASSNECAAYGNRNFFLFFTDWFGSTTTPIKGSIEKLYNKEDGINKLGEPKAKEKTDGNGFWWQEFEKGFIAGQASTGYFIIKGSIGKYYGANNGPKLLGKPLNTEVKDQNGIWSQKFIKGSVQGIGSGNYVSVLDGIDKYYRSGNNITRFGLPRGERKNLGGSTWEQEFEGGYVVGSSKTSYWESSGAVREHWLSVGGHNGRLRLPTGPIRDLGSNNIYQTYEGGAIIGSSHSNLQSLQGSIGSTYIQNFDSYYAHLGIPISGEKKIGKIWQQEFQRGYIVGANGKYFESYGEIRDRWIQMNGHSGAFGLPIDSYASGSRNMLWQRFKGGYIVKSPDSNNAWESKGSIRKVWGSNGYQSGKFGFPTGPEIKNRDGSWHQEYEHGVIRTLNGKDAGSHIRK